MTASPILETMAIVNSFFSDIGRVEHIGDGIMRLSLIVNQAGYEGGPERIVVLKLVGSQAAMKRLALQTLAGLTMSDGSAETVTLDRAGGLIQ